MTITRRIFVSSPRIEYLNNRHKEIKRAIVKEIEALGYEAQILAPLKKVEAWLQGDRGVPKTQKR